MKPRLGTVDKPRNRDGSFKTVIIPVICDVGHPCSASYQIQTCKNRHRCKRNNELGLRAELNEACHYSLRNVKTVKPCHNCVKDCRYKG